jgi:two-component system, NtrC family, response regulator
MERLLIVDDNEEIRSQLRWGLGKDYQVFTAGSFEECMTAFRRHSPRVVTLDLGLSPDANGAQEGFRCLENMLRLAPSAKIIVITGNEERENALRAVTSGAYDFYKKPIDISELKVILGRAFHLAAIEDENSHLQSFLSRKDLTLEGVVGQSSGMQEVFATVRKVASSNVAVLITGESGTGKELIARAIHLSSQRKAGPFVPINCGAIPENLLESELFGHERGAFSGAHARVQGKVEYAHRGTLFLDEIGELPLNLQVKFLRFLQEKTIQRVGGRDDIGVDARIIAATNRDIVKETEAGKFREDLYFRIAVIHICLPPLRERGEDILLLANIFLQKFARDLGKKVRRFSQDAVRELMSYEWPGNVRELENMVQRAVIMSDSTLLEASDLGINHKNARGSLIPMSGITLKDARERVERDMVRSAIASKGNMLKAAEALGISRPTLYDLVKKYSIDQCSGEKPG